jgi:hypothetical protein
MKIYIYNPWIVYIGRFPLYFKEEPNQEMILKAIDIEFVHPSQIEIKKVYRQKVIDQFNLSDINFVVVH